MAGEEAITSRKAGRSHVGGMEGNDGNGEWRDGDGLSQEEDGGCHFSGIPLSERDVETVDQKAIARVNLIPAIGFHPGSGDVEVHGQAVDNYRKEIIAAAATVDTERERLRGSAKDSQGRARFSSVKASDIYGVEVFEVVPQAEVKVLGHDTAPDVARVDKRIYSVTIE